MIKMLNVPGLEGFVKFVGNHGTFHQIVSQFEDECRKEGVTPEEIANTLDWIIYNLAKQEPGRRVEIAPGVHIHLVESYDEERGIKCQSCLGVGVNIVGNRSYFITGMPSGNKVVEGDPDTTLIGNLFPHFIRAHHFPEGNVRYGLKTEFLVELVRRVKVPTLMDRLNTGGLILMDGAIGTNVMRGMKTRNLHQMYYDSGSILSDTNTFVANPLKMRQERRDISECKGFNYEQVMAAKRINGINYIRGAIGPQPYILMMEQVTKDEIIKAYNIQLDALVRIAGVHCIAIETSYDPVSTRVVVDTAKKYDLPIMLSFSVHTSADNRLITNFGDFRDIFGQFEDVPIIGVNCCLPEDALKFLKEYRDRTGQFLMVEPNAGMPEIIGRENRYPLSPEQFADFSLKARKYGADLIGGCCGTTPEHIKAAHQALNS